MAEKRGDPEDDPEYDAAMAAIYDAVAAGREADVEFYVERAAAADGPVLELAVGSGRVYLEVLEAGVDADGVDVSPAMLAVLRERAAERGLDATVWEGDMRTLSADREYDLVYCPFNALQHARSVDDQQAVFESVHEALAPGGQFVFDVFVPNFDLIEATYGEWVTREDGDVVDGNAETGEVDARDDRGGVPGSEGMRAKGEFAERRTRTRFVNEPRQIVEVENEVLDAEGAVVHETSHRISVLPYQQIELLARASPFESWSVAGGFEAGANRDPGADGNPRADGDPRAVPHRDGSGGDSGEGPLEHGDQVQIWTLERS